MVEDLADEEEEYDQVDFLSINDEQNFETEIQPAQPTRRAYWQGAFLRRWKEWRAVLHWLPSDSSCWHWKLTHEAGLDSYKPSSAR